MAIRNDILEALIIRLREDVTEENGYPITIAAVEPFRVNALTAGHNKYPFIQVYEAGEDERRVIGADGFDQHLMTVVLHGVIHVSFDIAMREELENLISALRLFGDSSPDLGEHVMEFLITGIEQNWWGDIGEGLAATAMTCSIRYWAERGVH